MCVRIFFARSCTFTCVFVSCVQVYVMKRVGVCVVCKHACEVRHVCEVRMCVRCVDVCLVCRHICEMCMYFVCVYM